MHPPYRGEVREAVLGEAESGWVRVYVKGRNKEGDWFLRSDDIRGLSPEQIRDRWGLKYTPDSVVEVRFQAGTTMREGTVAGISDPKYAVGGAGPNRPGGGLQREWRSAPDATGKGVEYGDSRPLGGTR